MKIFHFLFPIMLIGIICLTAAGSAQAESSVSAKISIEPAEYTVGDPIPLRLAIHHPPGYEVILPQLEAGWGNLLVHSQTGGSTTSNPDGSETTTQLIDARIFSPGTFETPPLTISVIDNQGQLSEITAKPISLNIASVLVEGDSELRDIKPQAALPYVNYLPWLIVIGILISGTVGGYFLLHRRRKHGALVAMDNRLPHEVAIDELNRVESLGLPEAGRIKEHYTLVSDCIRLYFERRYAFPVLERTTAEIKSNLKRQELSPTIATEFINLLDESDLVKFSKFTPDLQSAHQVLVSGREIIDRTRPTTIEAENDENQIQISRPPNNPEFGKNGNNQEAEVTP